MNISQEKIIICIIACVLIILSGLWLYRIEKPYQTLPLTIHKLISLAVIALLVLVLRQVYLAGSATQPLVLASIALGVFLVTAIATGGIISAMKDAPVAALIIHRVSSVLVFVLMPTVIFIIRNINP